MSFTSSYAHKPPNYKGIGMAIGLHALFLAGAMSLPAITAEIPFEGVITAYPIEEDKKPEPPTQTIEDPAVKVKPVEQKARPQMPIVKPITLPKAPVVNYGDGDHAIELSGGGEGLDFPVVPLDPIAEPIMVPTKLSTRYRSQFQPPYPSGMLRQGIEAVITVKVLVGVNGKVKNIQLVDSPHPSFWTATQRHGLRKWRFEPATKDGVPIESWTMLKIKFEIHD
ncbi:MAG: TonB family protein [Parasphingorhabdus sp.]|uniref:energy transducer TonB n=1 Tax=Parasphingorhabdus sp. TaxID=2709688 RepID=UPI003299A727